MATIQDLGKVAYFNKGMYNSETNYEINDVVSYNGSSYVSLLNNNQGNLPTNATYWSVVALKGDKGDTGKPFVIEKTYESIEDMVADYDNMQVNDYVMIQGNIEEEENATLWTKTETEVSPYKWVYLADFSGASGITGATPNIQIGTVTEGNEPAVTRRAGSSNENPILDFVLKTGATGATGATGNGISSVSKTSTSGLTDTYTITYTNGNTTTFDVTNGKGIDRIEKTATVGNIDTYTIYFNDNSTSTFEVANGEVTREELEEEVDRLSMIYNLFPTTSDEDTEMTLDGTGEVKLKKIGLKGNTYQESTTGKNLLDINNLTANNATQQISGSTLTLTGTGTWSRTQKTLTLKANTSYTLMGWVKGTNGYNAGFVINDENQTYNVREIDNTGNRVYKCLNFNTNTYSTLVIQLFGNWDGTSANTTTVFEKVMLVEGTYTTEQDYEPYTNGASPNPDYPQDIQVVTGDNSIEVVGKQLFEQEYILAPNDNNKNAHLKAGTYTLATCDGNGFGAHVYFKLFDKNNNAITTSGHLTCSNVQIDFSTSSYNYYGGAGASYMTITIDNDYTIAIGLLNTTGDRQVMLVKGSEIVRTYAPYQSQSYAVNLGTMELCKIGDYQDYIYKYSGKWYLNKQIGKVVLDGSEDWAKSSKTTVHRYSVANIIQTVFNPDVVDLMSNYFTCITQNQSDDDNIGLSKLNANGFMNNFDLSNTGFDTLEKYKTWLSTHNTIVIYRLATPTVTEITDNTLIGQLDNLENAYSYDTQTNITQTNDDMPFILDVEALMSLKNIFNS